MSKFVHAADLHIDSPMRGLEAYEGAPVDRLRGATRRALSNLVQLVLDEGAAFLVLCGDIYDTAPSPETALYFRSQMQRLADAGVPVAIVLGNHDYAGVSPKNVALPDNVRVLSADEAQSWEIVPGVVVHGRSYPEQACHDDLTVGYPAARSGVLNVGLLHTCLEETDHAPYAPTSSAALVGMGYQYWALGHVHRFIEREENGCRIVFPGNLQGRHANETGEKGAVVVGYEGSSILSVERRALDVVRWHHVRVDARTLDDDVRAGVRKQVFDATTGDRQAGLLCAVRVTVAGQASGDALKLEADDLREYLMGELQGARGLLWLEKVKVDVHPAPADLQEIDTRLQALVEDLAASPEMLQELARTALDPVRKQVRDADRKLADDWGKDVDPRAVLERALHLLQKQIR